MLAGSTTGWIGLVEGSDVCKGLATSLDGVEVVVEGGGAVTGVADALLLAAGLDDETGVGLLAGVDAART